MEIRVFCCLLCVYLVYTQYICSAGYVELPIVLLDFEVRTLMLGVLHAIQHKKKLQKFTQSDSVYSEVSVVSTLMLGVSRAVEVFVLPWYVIDEGDRYQGTRYLVPGTWHQEAHRTEFND